MTGAVCRAEVSPWPNSPTFRPFLTLLFCRTPLPPPCEQQMTPLLYCCHTDKPEALDMLIRAGADLQYTTTAGMTALMISASLVRLVPR